MSSTVSATLKDDGDGRSENEMIPLALSSGLDASSSINMQASKESMDYASQSLKAELASLQHERAASIKKFDEKIYNVSRAISLLERR